ncbi:MAG: hypothetical protein Q8M19_29370 [Reyranella sp.]|nr:hypothetical protein [Reyranella sp.]
MHTKGMKRRGAFALAVGLAAMSAGAARAELVLNFPLKEYSKLSREASATLLYGATEILGSIQMAEFDRDKASSKLRAGISYLEKARPLFTELSKLVGQAPLHPDKMPLRKEAIGRIVSTHKIIIPKTMDELSRLAVSEVDRFIAATKEMGFESVQRARTTTLAFSEAINRLLDVGVLVSELAETADK